MPIIHVDHLVKEFRRPRQFDGPFGGLRSFLTRQYETKRAVENVTFDIEEGELIGYLGANGAGKSTSIKMLSGILTPTSGTVEVAGLVPWQNREQNALQIGVVFGQRTQLWWDLPLAHSLRLIGKLYRMDHDGKLLGWAQTSLGQGQTGCLIHSLHAEGDNVLYKGSCSLWNVERITIKE